MDGQADNIDSRSIARPILSRRSCDHCRARKIACDRGSPCSNCKHAKLECIHSAIAAALTPPKQRVLISAHYEKKIDEIADGIDEVKLLLQALDTSRHAPQPEVSSSLHLLQDHLIESPIDPQHVSPCDDDFVWQHSAHTIGFVRAITRDKVLDDAGPAANEVLSSLRDSLEVLEDSTTLQDSMLLGIKATKNLADWPMPSSDAVLKVLRWAAEHQEYARLAWISQVLPLHKFSESCKKVCFAIEKFTVEDFILANGYLSYIFSEHCMASGFQDYRIYQQLCSRNFDSALSRLPVHPPASVETIVALVLGAFKAIENSKASKAWTLVSMAINLCQTMGYHHLYSLQGNYKPLLKQNLFWSVYRIEKGLSLRLGHRSNIRDDEITLPLTSERPRSLRAAKIQGLVYDQIHSPTALSQSKDECARIVASLAQELRGLIHESRVEIAVALDQSSYHSKGSMRAFFLQCDLICQYATLALVLCASGLRQGHGSNLSEESVAVAREAMDIHHQCMGNIHSHRNEPFMTKWYINWVILHNPSILFSIVFTHAVRALDFTDLLRLEGFTASLKPDTVASTTHPYRLYKLLCQTARLYIDIQSSTQYTDWSSTHGLALMDDNFDLICFASTAET